jgi:putative transcriptional regulator
MPSHTHHGVEVTLVLQGSFSDPLGRYMRGDIAIADDEIDHKPVAGSEQDCICFAVTEGPVRLTGPVARLFNRLIGH